LSKKPHGKRIEIVIGGVNGDHGEIFSEKILFSRRKNLHFADFTAGIQRIQVKSGGEGKNPSGFLVGFADCHSSNQRFEVRHLGCGGRDTLPST